MRNKNTAATFWSSVDRSRGDDACWTWSRGTNGFGYGITSFSGKRVASHRAAWSLSNGPIPAGAHVLHRCDNPPCCNPSHLFLGSPADNMADRQNKGRTVLPMLRGEEHGRSKLTDKEVSDIRKAYACREESQTALASRFGISQQHVSELVRGVSRRCT